ncbi:SDR family NAD(P)-dependent oxidoreductase [Actinoplanes sp. LDG1-06]|uniref:SDR family NAD(P)-dependent oxidoreductase n=1 Tax=Paractinoplanes ovalisporus TaxID=2810368 RepID=A0ABS2AVA1_9ACTN|nr:SDR family NAD(P)-dependent oxidoreductase [Actinoplanes ovalisporus]MBM2623121.1 SDR family NAD(P)-dependent oxidoreductase [Actinoplanes ovalisporus]
MPVVIVTGASSGIGRVTAERLARNGATVVLAARRADKLTALAAELPNAVAVPTDVRDPAAIADLVARAAEINGRVDGLVNNAGVGGVASVLSADDAVEGMIQVNLLAPIRLMRAVVPLMRDQGGGAIVNIGSVAGEVGMSGVYSATKFALRGMTDSVRRELAGTGIGVTLIEPGYIAGAANRNRSGLPGPEIVAAAVEKALRRPRRRMIVPARYRVAILAANVLPAVADRMYAGKAAGKGDVKGNL